MHKINIHTECENPSYKNHWPNNVSSSSDLCVHIQESFENIMRLHLFQNNFLYILDLSLDGTKSIIQMIKYKKKTKKKTWLLMSQNQDHIKEKR